MLKQKTYYLIELIGSLTKSEKRHFKLHTQKVGSSDKIYVQLFDYIEKHGVFDEEQLLKKLPFIKKAQLSNLKANLYKQLLRSLRDYNKESYSEIKAREKFDFAKVLYAKGQYKASIAMLQQVKKLANTIQKKPLLYLAISFEKQIETQHVTGSMAKRAAQLAQRSLDIVGELELTDILSNLSLTMYGLYLKRGYVKSEKDVKYLKKYFDSHLPDHEEGELDFYQRLHLYQSHVWYYQMLQDFRQYYRYALKWVELFEEYPDMKIPETTTYIKGLHNILNSLFSLARYDHFESALKVLWNFKTLHPAKLSRNEDSQLELFGYIHGLNLIFLNTKYSDGVAYVEGLSNVLESKKYPWDLNRELVFYYKIACVYYGANDLGKTIFFLNKITNQYYPGFKEDIQCFARILNLIAHYDLDNEALVSYQVKSVYRFLLKMKEMQKVQHEVFKFIRRTPNMLRSDVRQEFILLKEKLLLLRKDKMERRPFLYLDIISWLDSKIKGITMVEAIRERRNITVT